MPTELLITFAVAHWLAAASPGPNFFLVSNLASNASRRHGLFAALGVAVSVFVWSLAAAAGLNVFLDQFPALRSALKYAGAAYLIWLGCRMIWSVLRPAVVSTAATSATSVSGDLTAMSRGFLVNISNPKTVAYYTSVFAVLVPAESSASAFAQIVVTAVVVSWVWWSLVAIAFSTGTVRRAFLSIRRHIDMLAGCAFIYFGFRLANR